MKSFWNRSYAPHLVVLAAYILLAVVMTLPLVFQMGDHLLGTDINALNDTYLSVWIFGWQAHQLIADPINLFQGNIFYPFQNTLAFSEIILPGALLYLPLESATANPVLAYNLTLLIVLPLDAFAMYLFALDWFATTPMAVVRRPSSVVSAFLAGVIFAFCTYIMGELRHVQLLLTLFIPLTLMYLARFVRKPNLHNAFFTALFFALNALSCLYYAVFLAFAIALYLGIDFIARRFRLTRAHILYGALALGIAVLIVLPFLLPFFGLQREYNFSAGREPRLFSARPASYIATPASQWLYGKLTRDFYVASKGQPLFPGVVVLALATLGFIALFRQSKRAAIFLVLLVLMGFVLSFGPDLMRDRTGAALLHFPLPYFALAKIIPLLNSLNAPSRFVILLMFALSLAAAYGVLVLMQRAPRWAWGVALACLVLVVLEYIPIPLRLKPVATGANISPVYQFLRAQPRGQVVVEVPMGSATAAGQDQYVVYTYNAIYHLKPLVNGNSTFIPPAYYALVQDVSAFPASSAVQRLQKWGAQWLVVHSEQYPNPNALRQQLAQRKALQHVQDFGKTWLYKIGK